MPRCPDPLPRDLSLLAVDSGWTSPGAAVMERGRIVRAIRVRIPDSYADLGPMERSRAVVVAILTQVDPHARGFAHLVAEWPQVDERTRRLNPESLFGMCGVAGALSAKLNPLRQLSPQPRDWVGNVPKVTTGPAWNSPRAHMLRSILSPDEVEAIEESHDAIDAAALAYWAVGLFPPPNKYPRAPKAR